MFTGNKNSLFIETSVGVVGVVKKGRSHQKCCGGMGCVVVQHAQYLSVHYQSDL